MSVSDAKIFRIGDTDIRVEIDKYKRENEPKISLMEIETDEYLGDDFKGRAVSRINLSYGEIKAVAATARTFSDFLEKFAVIQDIFDSKHQEGNESIFRRSFGLIHPEEVQEAIMAVEILKKYENIASYLGERLRIVEESLKLTEEPRQVQEIPAQAAEIPIEMDDTIE